MAGETRMTRDEARRLAEAVADRLFVNGFGEQATRLVLVQEANGQRRDLGGWCRQSVVDQVEAALLTRAGRDDGETR